MSKRDRKLKTIERRWIAQFGEPPSLRTDPWLMLQILEGDLASRGRDESPTLNEAEA
jgi:hypothetical protein